MNVDGARLKCNREKPCQNCTARDEQITCKYKGSRNGSTPLPYRDEHVDPMGQRIDHLEGLVKSLIAQQQGTPPNNVTRSQDSQKPGTGTVASDASDVARSTGTTVIDGVYSVYKGVDDWYDVLQEVSRFLFYFFSIPILFFSFLSIFDTHPLLYIWTLH